MTVGGGVKDWSPVESGAGTIAPSRPRPHIQRHSPATSVTPPRGTPKAPPLYVTGVPRPKKRAQMTEHFKAPEIIQLSSEQIANLSDAQLKTLVIKKLTELVDLVKN